jgi:hypothetical protein
MRDFRPYCEEGNLFDRLGSDDVKWKCDGHVTAAASQGSARIPIGCQLVPLGNVIALQSHIETLPSPLSQPLPQIRHTRSTCSLNFITRSNRTVLDAQSGNLFSPSHFLKEHTTYPFGAVI